jgi:hypothetical protein
VAVEDFEANVPKSPSDVICIVKPFLSSEQVLQVKAVCPASRVWALPQMPGGLRPRKPIPAKVQYDTQKYAQEALERGFISPAAYAYLHGWVSSSLSRQPRPPRYPFLEHRWRERNEPHLDILPLAAPVKRMRITLRPFPGLQVPSESLHHARGGASDDAEPGDLEV